MIPGTRARNQRKNPESSVDEKKPHTEQLDRRALFQNILPALGIGVVKIVRSSNNLRRDAQEILEERARAKTSKALGEEKK